MMVEIQNLRREFGKTVAVDNVSFSFNSGEIYGFIGPNGAGKTTTMRIMATLDEPTSGDVFINGISAIEEPDLIRQIIGYVPDSLRAYWDTTVHEYLDFFARAYGIKGSRREAAVKNVETFAGLTGISEKKLTALSKGMRQRVSLARALINDPQVLILDEPAAGLDPRARIELRELLILLAEQNKSILISSHILTELTEICHGVAIIERGRILENGTIEQVTQRRATRRTFALRVEDSLPEVLRDLLQTPNVDNARIAANEILFEIEGSTSVAADILSSLVHRKYRVTEFREARANLEDIFMNVTKGELQ
ncbi:MAG: ABC transporter ATP-binding protein [Pedosphaera sp.]|nr:ABC transporter ATP-binding protein [Pedosphaera sp.]MST00377.1 ABC transporter ATP-binding protein [Pedosphaera sp.]